MLALSGRQAGQGVGVVVELYGDRKTWPSAAPNAVGRQPTSDQTAPGKGPGQSRREKNERGFETSHYIIVPSTQALTR